MQTDFKTGWVRIYRKAGKRCQYGKARQVTEAMILEGSGDSDREILGKTLNGYISRRSLGPGDWLIYNWKLVYGFSAKNFKALAWRFSYEDAMGHPRNPHSDSSIRERLLKKRLSG